MGPTALGEIPAPSIERLRAIGAWMDVNGESIYGTTPSLFENLPWGRCTKKLHKGGATLYLHVFEWPADGKLRVPGLKNTVKTARLLDGGKVLDTVSSHNSIVISLPKISPDPVASVVVVDVEGPLYIVPVGQFKAIGPREPVQVPPFTKAAARANTSPL